MQITVVIFVALALATMIPITLATPVPIPASTDNNSDGALQQLNPSLDGSDDVHHKLWTWNPVAVGECKQEGASSRSTRTAASSGMPSSGRAGS